MRNILNKLASIADEADAAGHFKIANDLDNVIKVLAAADYMDDTGQSVPGATPGTGSHEYGTSEEMTLAPGEAEGDWQKSKGAPAEPDRALIEQYKKQQRQAALMASFKKKLEEISALYTNPGPGREPMSPPFKLSPGPLAYKDLVHVFKLANMDPNPKSVKQINDMLAALKQNVLDYLIDIGSDPFMLRGVSEVMKSPQKEVLKRIKDR